jgi:GH15 family glucan-1,4-alpha-glucosidase
VPARIEDYALIGDCHTAALVSRDGSIDWLCFPRFDSPACFAALIGEADNGRWQIRPSVAVRATRRRYRGDTLILETDFECDHGAVTMIDFMPPRGSALDVVRIVQGRRGRVPMHMELVIRFDYGSIVPWVHRIEGGISALAGPDTIYCHSEVDLQGQGMSTVADFSVSEGQSVPFLLTWCQTHTSAPKVRDWRESLGETEKWWTKWAGNCTYHGEWRDAVMRSLLTLKALTYRPTGGIVAAPTTSLPEKLGGVRNWDYRYCWMRDATFALYALIVGGYHEEAKAWREWLVRAVAGTPSKLQIMYGVAGERRLTELELDWLSGFEKSKPVRIGNGAHRQHQLDVYGEIMDVMQLAWRSGLQPTDDTWRVQRALLDYLEDGWKDPDEGIWEMRGQRRQFTHSKVMAWVAMDRAVNGVERFGLEGDVGKWREVRARIYEEVCRLGFDPHLNSFVQYYGSKDPDASLLMLPTVGFMEAGDPRMRGTVALIERELLEEGFIRRYPAKPDIDGLPAGEGAFLLCTFWYADVLALQERRAQAREILEGLLDLRNDVGLLPEEYDVAEKRFLGNFPQAFSHIGLINTIRNLSGAGGPAEHRSERPAQPGEQRSPDHDTDAGVEHASV